MLPAGKQCALPPLRGGREGGRTLPQPSYFSPSPSSPSARGERGRCGGFAVRPLLASALLAACLVAPAAPLALKYAVAKVELPSLTPETGRIVVDRNGVLLRPFTISDGRWRLPVTARRRRSALRRTLIAYEDRRFAQHRGIDMKALFRAACSSSRHGPSSPAARPSPCRSRACFEPARPAALGGKLRQIVHGAGARAPADARTRSSTLYLTLAPYGGNIEGVRAASLAYFGKEPRRLTPAEAALLVALPQSPEARRPDRNPAPRAPRATACSTALVGDGGSSRPRRRRPRQREPIPDRPPRLPHARRASRQSAP